MQSWFHKPGLALHEDNQGALSGMRPNLPHLQSSAGKAHSFRGGSVNAFCGAQPPLGSAPVITRRRMRTYWLWIGSEARIQ